VLLIAGDTDLVLGGLTAMESAVEIAVLKLVCDPVLSAPNAARRGRGTDVCVLGCVRVSPLAEALLVMRAAN